VLADKLDRGSNKARMVRVCEGELSFILADDFEQTLCHPAAGFPVRTERKLAIREGNLGNFCYFSIAGIDSRYHEIATNVHNCVDNLARVFVRPAPCSKKLLHSGLT
jgi:hypothetical protein